MLEMYLIDTNVLSDVRKKSKANPGVLDFFDRVNASELRVYISVITVGELRRGVELIRHRGDSGQAEHLEKWLQSLLNEYSDHILGLDADTAQLWGLLRVPRSENALDKQIAATALIHDLTVVTRNEKHFVDTGVTVLNPFKATS